MLLPLLLLGLAVLSAAVVAYGTAAFWAQFAHGIGVIVWSRRLQWPLVTLCLLLCLALLALVISGRRRAWWLIGLGPVLALFVHRFLVDPSGAFTILENPTFVPAADASFLTDDDYVVGLQFGDSSYAYPYRELFRDPVVLQSDHDRRLILMWSAFANRAVASTISRDVRARDLEIVSMPANAMLLYNRAWGQFVNALRGRTLTDRTPFGFLKSVPVTTMTWRDWRRLNPQTAVMQPAAGAHAADGPSGPILPTNPMPPAILDVPAETSIALVGVDQFAALRSDRIGPEPVDVTADGGPVFVFRAETGGPVRAFSCFLKKQALFPHFRLDREHRYPNAMFLDSDTGSGWSAAGIWIDGRKEYRRQFKGARLTPVPVQDHLYWGVMKFWYPDLRLGEAATTHAVASGS